MLILLRAFLVCLGIAAFTWLGFVYFPGHTYLQSDTQIYLPMMERLVHPGYLARDIVAMRPHIAYTIYDEVTLAIRRLAHTDFEHAFVAQQLATRAFAMLGVYLLATAAGVASAYAIGIAAFVNLGASLLGPAVLLVEYEPVPRGFAFCLVLLALGLLSHRWTLLAGLAAGVAFLYQPPAAIPFWGIVLLGFTFDREARRRWKPLLVALVIACLLLANLAQLQPDIVEAQNFFGKLSSRMMEIQHLRTRYVWVTLWADRDIWSYLALAVCALWAFSRFASRVHREMRWFYAGLPFAGLLSVPFSYLFLEHWHYAIVSQAQPARALVYTVAVASLSCGIASMLAAQQRRAVEAALWLLPVIAIPLNVRVLDLFALRSAASLRTFLFWMGASAVTGLFAATVSRAFWTRPALLAAPALLLWILPNWAHVETYSEIDKRPLASLAYWASEATWGSSMFLFPQAAHGLEPGIFRALSERALYVDWKSGGQVNYFETFAEEWHSRFEQTVDGAFTVARLESMLSLPIDYYVLNSDTTLAGVPPVFRNAQYVVYDAQALRNLSEPLRFGPTERPPALPPRAPNRSKVRRGTASTPRH